MQFEHTTNKQYTQLNQTPLDRKLHLTGGSGSQSPLTPKISNYRVKRYKKLLCCLLIFLFMTTVLTVKQPVRVRQSEALQKPLSSMTGGLSTCGPPPYSFSCWNHSLGLHIMMLCALSGFKNHFSVPMHFLHVSWIHLENMKIWHQYKPMCSLLLQKCWK